MRNYDDSLFLLTGKVFETYVNILKKATLRKKSLCASQASSKTEKNTIKILTDELSAYSCSLS